MKNFSLKAAFFKVFLPFFLITAFAQEAMGQTNTKLDQEFKEVACKVDPSGGIGIRFPVNSNAADQSCLQGIYLKQRFDPDSLRMEAFKYEVIPQDGKDKVNVPKNATTWSKTIAYPEGFSAEEAFENMQEQLCIPCVEGTLER